MKKEQDYYICKECGSLEITNPISISNEYCTLCFVSGLNRVVSETSALSNVDELIERECLEIELIE